MASGIADCERIHSDWVASETDSHYDQIPHLEEDVEQVENTEDSSDADDEGIAGQVGTDAGQVSTDAGQVSADAADFELNQEDADSGTADQMSVVVEVLACNEFVLDHVIDDD